MASTERAVIAGYRQLLRDGAISRIGGAWGAGAGGAALLCAFAVPAQRLEAVAACVSAHPGVNHNYEREHHHNLWFVITGRDAAAVGRAVDELEAQTGCRALRLRMRRAYRIDLGFDLRDPLAPRGRFAARSVVPVDAGDAPLAALVEGGLPLVERPYDAWGRALHQPAQQVLATLATWLDQGTLRRFGAIVRHHEAGYTHNAMTVFDVPDDFGRPLRHRARRATRRDAGVPARTRRWLALQPVLHGARPRPGRGAGGDPPARSTVVRWPQHPRAVLFSRRRFKQGGASYFRAPAEREQRDAA